MKIVDNRLVLEDDDFFNLDETLGTIIQDALIQFKERTNSYPSEFSQPTKEQPNGTVSCDQAVADWNRAIDKMIKGFSVFEEEEELYQTIDGIECPYDYKQNWFVDKVFTPCYKEGFTAEDAEAYDAAKDLRESEDSKERLEGRILFAKFFNHLWE